MTNEKRNTAIMDKVERYTQHHTATPNLAQEAIERATMTNDKDSAVLLPCEFCRTAPVHFENAYETGYIIHCPDEDCMVSPYVEMGTKEQSIAAWNTRQPTQSAALAERKLPQDVIDFIEQTTLLATNHGGWFDPHGFKAISPLCDKGNALLHKYCPENGGAKQMTHDSAAEWQAGHDAAVDALKNPTPELVERAVIAFNNVPQRLCNSDGEVAMIAALTAAAAYLFAENANECRSYQVRLDN